MKRIVILSDLHCGHLAGLTPPGWQLPSRGEVDDPRIQWGRLQRELYTWFSKELRALQPIDWLVVNGDAIDGRGSRSGGSELLTTDLDEQTRMAAACIEEAQAANHLIIHGTPYHVGPDGEDWESILAERVGGMAGGHEWLDVNGCIFDFKHKIGSSGVPHGRHTAVARERLWNVLWNERNWAPKARVIIRSHVHYHAFSGDPTHIAMTTPALQGPGSKYGVRQCSGIVDFGFIHFDVDDDGGFSWQAHLLDIKQTRPKAVKA
jgi:hypothetical protein